ncbi:hypothetical protein EBQ25_03670 [Allofranklinella schreckenbergeri]|uniref:LPS-assembly lipoprotein LptE n=1 Tax=Allofranklinella schreckenbergeri TaxID=1076744 RepID=A0A3M6QF84_9BURK|nr:LPS assembly lipoprotein LptE [Allofranklinella schreckenbergeri]RMX01756.1 hypothetical protein EBQ25_03670 [Allofranklinella schreckenbergeri]
MQRRQFLTRSATATAAAVVTVTAAASLSACGFALRGSANYPFKSVFIQAADASPLARQLQRTLEAAGITVLRAPSSPQMAEKVFELLQEQHERVVVSQSAAGNVRELQLRLRVRYRLTSAHAPTSSQGSGQTAAQTTELLQTRDLNYDETYALAKEEEAQMLFRDMQADLVGQIVRRLAS